MPLPALIDALAEGALGVLADPSESVTSPVGAARS